MSAVLVSSKSRTVLVLLSFFLGVFGIDRFYAGRIGLGIAKIFLGWTGWFFIDFLIALFGAMKDENGASISKW